MKDWIQNYCDLLTKILSLLCSLVDSSAEKPAQESSSPGGGWGWGGWTSVLSHATASVTSGLSSVIATVETSLGVPDPEEIARKVKAEEKLVQEKRAEAKTQETLAENKSESKNENEGLWVTIMYACFVQWNLDLTKYQETGEIGSLYQGFVILKTLM